MCGILLAIQRQEDVIEDFECAWKLLKTTNLARGPDAQEEVCLILHTGKGTVLDVRLFGSELRLRGARPVIQPHQSAGNVFCWNGEVFEGLQLNTSENDGVRLFQTILRLQDPEIELSSVFRSIEGPYAFTYFHAATNRLYFGRDSLGRRSLLIHKPTKQKPVLLLASVSAGQTPLFDFEEVATSILFCADLGNWRSDNNIYTLLALRTISRCSGASHNHNNDFSAPQRVNNLVEDVPPPKESLSSIPPTLVDAVDNLLCQLSRSVRLMVEDIPYQSPRERHQARVALLFSGGIDCTILAYLADRYIPHDEPIDLLNVAFENPRKTKTNEKIQSKRRNQRHTSPSPTAQANSKFESYLVPDRVTGLEELVELQRLCPHRRWNFVEVDISFEETSKYRSVVENLMFPCRTVMDLSLALALYFASRGVGHVREEPDGPKIPYASTARVLLNGLGSDELLGGYGRHRTAYALGGWSAVIAELQLEIDRIPTRNLGRDDRIMSSHGKEARHPFLSLSVVNFIVGLPVHCKMDPRLPLGVGDKLLLRLAARKVGLELASSRQKRAMQFGSHSARMEGGESERRGDLLIS